MIVWSILVSHFNQDGFQMNTKYGLYVYVITRMVENHTLGRDLTWISFAVAYGMTSVGRFVAPSPPPMVKIS